MTAPGFFVSKSGLFVGRLFSEPDKGVPVATHTLFYKELIITRFDSEGICMCFAEQVFFARLGARSVAPQRRAYAQRAA